MGQFKVYTNSKGNYYHDEIAGLIAHSLRKFSTVKRGNENSVFSDEDWNIIVAPHEFFAIGRGRKLGRTTLPEKTIFITTEQPQSLWFEKSLPLLDKAFALWDLDLRTAGVLGSYHKNVFHMPIGWERDYVHFREISELPFNSSYYFGDEVYQSPSRLLGKYEDRPIDVFFLGGYTCRREELIATMVEDLMEFKCCLLVQNGSKPVRPGVNTSLNSTTVCALEQRSKIVLNLHRDSEIYFESHRLIYHGVAQGALVISEPLISQNRREVIPFVEVSKGELGRTIRYYLKDSKGKEMASHLAKKQYNALIAGESMSSTLRKLTDLLPS